MDSVTTTNFSLPKWDAKKKSSWFIGLILFGTIGYLFVQYILPWLVGVVWNMVNLIIGGAILAFLLMIVTNKKFWRGMHYLTEGIARYTLGIIIELNPFEILLEKVEEGEKDAQKLKIHGDELKAQQISLSSQIDDKDKEMRQAAAEVKVCQNALAKNPNDFDSQLNLQSSSTDFANAKDYIDELKPLQNSVTQMADFADKGYRKAMVELKTQRSTIQMNKQKYAIVTSANAAMSSAVKAFFGDNDLNRDADQALEVLKKNLAKQLGNIKSNIALTSEAMNHIDVRDAAKMSLAVEAAKQFEVDQNMDYSHSLGNDNGIIGLDQKQLTSGASANNKYADFLNNKK